MAHKVRSWAYFLIDAKAGADDKRAGRDPSRRKPSARYRKKLREFYARLEKWKTEDPPRYERMVKLTKKLREKFRGEQSKKAAKLLASNMFEAVVDPPNAKRVNYGRDASRRKKHKKSYSRDPNYMHIIQLITTAEDKMLSSQEAAKRGQVEKARSLYKEGTARANLATDLFRRYEMRMEQGEIEDIRNNMKDYLREASKAHKLIESRSMNDPRDPSRRRKPSARYYGRDAARNKKPRRKRTMKKSHPMAPYFAWVKKNHKKFQKADGRLDMKRMWAYWKKHHA